MKGKAVGAIESKTISGALELALAALEGAIDKRRIDTYDPYWRWYDGPRADAVKALHEALGK